jgi:hypothetical protein
MKLLLHVVFDVAVIETLLALLMTFGHRLGVMGRFVTSACTRAPWLDLVVGIFTWIPWMIGALTLGWRGLIGSMAGEVIALFIWINVHEWVYREATAGPRIVKFINRVVGRWQNHLALWVTVVAFPGFLFIRLMEVVMYPALIRLLDFPKYDQAQWVNVSRQKFSGLVGHDLIWCLYCDWMTGVYALGAEMLRNVESFWCPIRFYDGKKCENCKLDFPDVTGGWVPADGDMRQVDEKMQAMYGDGQRTWFGHPVRLTVKGR